MHGRDRFNRIARMALAAMVVAAGPLRGQDARRLDALLASDSVAAAAQAAESALASMSWSDRTRLGAMFGRFSVVDASDAPLDPVPGTTALLTRLAAGAVPAAVDQVEFSLLSQRQSAACLRAITELGFLRRGFGAALRATSDDPAILLLVYEAAHDTAGVRELRDALALARSRVAQRNAPPPLALAEADLYLGDTANALVRLLAFDASWTVMERPVSWGAVQNAWTLGRTWLLLGDVAAATGRRADARRAYERVIALWADGDEDVQPFVARARAWIEGRTIPSSSNPAAVSLRPLATAGGRFRYDAVLWATSDQPLARMSFVTTEDAATVAGGALVTQRFDSVILDMPLLDRMGAEGLALRRQVQGSAGVMTTETVIDTLGRVASRSLHAPSLPDDLRSLLEGPIGLGPLAGAVPLRSTEAHPGDQWTDTLSLMIPGTGMRVSLRAEYRLARVTEAGGRRLAFITVAARGPGATLTGELVRDVDSGESLRLAASLRTATARVLLTALRENTAPAPTFAMR